ncbi:MAG TPA: hypothetical protein VJ385_19025 [Fibrobacteria bacterium]|nr:hypothetical protein [Fibrobacteria bacterium]
MFPTLVKPACASGLLMLASLAVPARAADSLVFNQDGFTVLKRTSGSDWTYVLTDTRAGTSLQVGQVGANIGKFIAKVNGIPYSVLHGEGNWKLMPWPNRTKGGKFTDAKGAVRDLMITDNQGTLLTSREGNGNALHGMVKDRRWSVESFGADAEGVYLQCYFDTQGFASLEALFGAFRDHTVYRLKGNRLIIDAFTDNKSDQPFENCGWGFHPFFNAPLVPQQGAQKGSRARCALTIPAKTVALTDGAKIPIGSEPVAAHAGGRFDFTKLRSADRNDVDHYFTDLSEESGSGYTRSALIDYGNAVRVQILGQYPFYPWMVAYIPGREFLCIEPMTEETNGLNTKQHLIRIPARSRSPVGRILMEVDGDTTLSFKAPTALREGPRIAPLRRDREGAGRLIWDGTRMRFAPAGEAFRAGRRFDAAGALRGPSVRAGSGPEAADGALELLSDGEGRP